MDESKSKDLVVTKGHAPTLKLDQTVSLDLSGLSESQITELKMRHAEGMVDLAKKATEIGIDVKALDASLTSFNTQTDRATQGGYSATIQHSQTTSIGRTDVIIGNTEKAASGRLSRSVTGAGCLQQIVLIVAAVFVLIAIFGG